MGVAGDVEVTQPGDTCPVTDPPHRRGGHGDAVGGELHDDQSGRQLPFPPQVQDLVHDRAWRRCRLVAWPGGHIDQSGVAVGLVAADPLRHRRPGQVRLRGDMGDRARGAGVKAKDAPDQATTTLDGQGGISVRNGQVSCRSRGAGWLW